MELTRDDMPAHEQANSFAPACAAVESAEFTLGPRQDVVDLVFHRLERKPGASKGITIRTMGLRLRTGKNLSRILVKTMLD